MKSKVDKPNANNTKPQLVLEFNVKTQKEARVVNFNTFGEFTPSKISLREQIIKNTKSF